ncbi:MAG: hypothetical protein JKY60_05185 [Kordiimonadaceae bacterium]|nr:hypothetical protein [Kordiimonadaceae bacterium]
MRSLLLLCWVALGMTLIGSTVYAQDEPQDDELLKEGRLSLKFEPFRIAVLRRGRVTGTADLQITLQLRNNNEYEELKAKLPQLRSDMVSALSSLSRRRWLISRPIDPDIVSRYLKPYVDRRVGAGRLDIYVLKALIDPA